MKKVLLTLQLPGEKGYVGGVASIINSYMANEVLFNHAGYEIELFNYKEPRWTCGLPSKIRNVIYGILQRKALSKKIKKEKETLVHIHTSREWLFLKDMLLTRYLNKHFGTKVIITVHVGRTDTVFNRIGVFEKWCINAMNNYVARLILLSEEIKKDFVELGVNEEICKVLYNFHSLDPTNKSLDILDDNEAIELLFVGAIHREKGIIELLKAMQEFRGKPVHVSICGQLTDPSIEKEFEALTKRLGDQIDVLGYVKGKEKSNVFAKADVLILPSYHEGFPLVILEALAAKCAIISTPVGTIPEVLDSNNYISVEIGEVVSLVDAIILFLKDPDALKSMKRNNYQKSKAFSIDKHIEKLTTIYNEI